MNTFFLLLFLVSPILLIVGLIRPKTFSKILRSTSRKRVGLVSVLLLVSSFVGFGFTLDSSKVRQNEIDLPPAETVEVKQDSIPTETQLQPQEYVSELDETQEQTAQQDEKQASDMEEILEPVQPQTNSAEASQSFVVPSTTEPPESSQTEANEQSTKIGYKVSSVVDGDTIKVVIDGKEESIRLIGIDTPETVDPRKPVQCFGKEASDKAKETLSGQTVFLENDPSQGDTDKYQRLLRYVFLQDGTFFNKMMVEQGFAHEYTYDQPYKYQSDFKAAQKAAEASQLGLWNPETCNGDTTTSADTSESQASETNTQTSTTTNGHVFYLSTYYSAVYYYCDTDSAWKELSTKYLKSYSSEEALLTDFPNRTLHEACR